MIFLYILFVIVAVILVLVIMIQDEQGEGIGGIFGGGSTTPFGSRSGNVLTRFTSAFAALFLFGSFMLGWMNRSEKTDLPEVEAQQQEEVVDYLTPEELAANTETVETSSTTLDTSITIPTPGLDNLGMDMDLLETPTIATGDE
jgi:preprotein translocase subunit SecG